MGSNEPQRVPAGERRGGQETKTEEDTERVSEARSGRVEDRERVRERGIEGEREKTEGRIAKSIFCLCHAHEKGGGLFGPDWKFKEGAYLLPTRREGGNEEA